MNPQCPKCTESDCTDESRNSVVRYGYFRRSSDSRKVQKYLCKVCFHQFSRPHPCRWQKKRHKNHALGRLLASGVSQRRVAKLLNLSRTTVTRKFLFLGLEALTKLSAGNLNRPKASVMVFDDLETFEHTKCKPLSVTLAVNEKRRILGFRVARMPAKGRLARIAFMKYGPRLDERKLNRQNLFSELQAIVEPFALIKSDQNPHYRSDVLKYFPHSIYESHKGQRSSTIGQGELKMVRFDPLFCLNHTLAMTRANINRLFRRTWCTTKLPERLNLHLAIYSVYHNNILLDGS